MLITKEQQQSLIDKFIKNGCNADQLDGFEQGIKAMLGLVAKLSDVKLVCVGKCDHDYNDEFGNELFCSIKTKKQ